MTAAIIWLRRDLRLSDNPALSQAVDAGYTPIPLYIHNDLETVWTEGAASRWWLHHSLASLRHSLQQCGSDLLLLQGNPADLLPRVARQFEATAVYWNRRYYKTAIDQDAGLKQTLVKNGIEVKSFNASLLLEPWQHLKKDQTPYRVFTPFWKALSHRLNDSWPLAAPDTLPALPASTMQQSAQLQTLGLLPGISWDEDFYSHWQPGEAGARAHLQDFVEDCLLNYSSGRDYPSQAATSRLSPHLHFGEISPRQIWTFLREQSAMQPSLETATDSYLRQLGWREFAYHLLFHFPETPEQPLNARFNAFPWRENYDQDLNSWQRGQTGIPIVDAGMRELWQTGWMHNRVRMIVASLLCKNLLIPWQEGAHWFWDTLVDADLANNTLGWQWVAGCGADAAPYFRVFNPVLQGEKFDKNGHYVRHWVPELARMPSKWIHAPWRAPTEVLNEAGIALGSHYPHPIVDLAGSRTRALQAWDAVKSNHVDK